MHDRLLLLASVVVALSAGCAAPDDEPPPSTPGPIEATAVGEPAVATLGVGGGDVVLEGVGGAMTLTIPALALTADTEITLQEVDLDGVEGERAVRFSPDGLVFARAALLAFAPAPAGDVVVGLAFDEGDEVAELIFTAPFAGGVTMPIEHFSDAMAIEAEAARQMLGEEDGDDAASVEATESIALGLGETQRRVVEPAAEVAAQTTEQWRFAKTALEAWHADVLGTASGALPGSLRDPETLAAAYARLDAVIDAAGLALLERMQTPTCEEPGDEIGDLQDWVVVPFGLQAELQAVGVNATFDRPCVTTDLRVDGDQVLEATTDEVVLDLDFQLVFFDGSRREPMALVHFTLNATGATGPLLFESRDGRAPDLVFTRPAAPDRPRVVTIVIGVDTGETQYGTFLPPAPFTFVAREPSLGPAQGTITQTTTSSCGSQTASNNDHIRSETRTLVATVSSDADGNIVSVAGTFESQSNDLDEDTDCPTETFVSTLSGAPILGPFTDDQENVAPLAAMTLTDATTGTLVVYVVCSQPAHAECDGSDPGFASRVCEGIELPFTRLPNGDYDFALSIAAEPCGATGVEGSGLMVLAPP